MKKVIFRTHRKIWLVGVNLHNRVPLLVLLVERQKALWLGRLVFVLSIIYAIEALYFKNMICAYC